MRDAYLISAAKEGEWHIIARAVAIAVPDRRPNDSTLYACLMMALTMRNTPAADLTAAHAIRGMVAFDVMARQAVLSAVRRDFQQATGAALDNPAVQSDTCFKYEIESARRDAMKLRSSEGPAYRLSA